MGDTSNWKKKITKFTYLGKEAIKEGEGYLYKGTSRNLRETQKQMRKDFLRNALSKNKLNDNTNRQIRQMPRNHNNNNRELKNLKQQILKKFYSK